MPKIVSGKNDTPHRIGKTINLIGLASRNRDGKAKGWD